jgi:magnesium chelatase subunit I
VSARFAVAGAETVSAAAVRRAAVLGEADAVARPVDLESVVEVLRGKVEFESGEEGRELEVLEHLLRRATADTVRVRLGGIDLGMLVAAVEMGNTIVTGESVTAKALLDELPEIEVLDEIAERLGAQSDGERAAGAELALEGLYLARRISKDQGPGGRSVYS